MNFAKKCKELRIKKAATQEQMAAAMGLSSQAISKWENGVDFTGYYFVAGNFSIFWRNN